MHDPHRPQKLEASQTTEGGMKTQFASLAGILDSTQNSSFQSSRSGHLQMASAWTPYLSSCSSPFST